MIIGVILIMFGVKNNNFVKKYYEYVKFLAVDSNMYISVLAVSVHETVQTTQKNIMRMIELGFSRIYSLMRGRQAYLGRCDERKQHIVRYAAF